MNPQDLDPICSPHLEERLICGNVDLDLLSIFPQEWARIMGGIKSNSKILNSKNGGERVEKDRQQAGRRGYKQPPPRIWPLELFPALAVLPPAPAVVPLKYPHKEPSITASRHSLWRYKGGTGGGTTATEKTLDNMLRKVQYLLHTDSEFDDLGIVSKRTTSSTRLCR